jgi:cellulose synthase/poly-beta-1,6-N-acetylglucosamine synthase-like glycosyltransferase
MIANNAHKNFRIAMVIFAHNESLLIQRTTKAVLLALRNKDSLFVVADNCTDRTASLASQAGAQVFYRNMDHPLGKGAAISWFIQNYSTLLLEFDYLVVLDADSQIQLDFIDKLNLALAPDVIAAQCILRPAEYEDSPLSTLIALSEIVEHTVFERIKSIVGLSVRMRGTGMVLKPEILLEVSKEIDTEVEDIALSILLAEKKIKVHSVNTVVVYDPKPSEMAAASRQRARWFRGQWMAFLKYRSMILKLVLSGLNGWSVLSSLFLKPRWLKILIMICLGFSLLHFQILSGAIFTLVLLEIILFMIGVLRLPDKWKFIRAMVYIPGFVLMWIKGIVLSLQRLPWLRARQTESKVDWNEKNNPTLCNLPK